MRVLFLGAEHPSSTSRHRAEAFRRLGHEVRHLDPLGTFAHRLRGNIGRLHYHTGYTLLRGAVVDWLEEALGAGPGYELCWVDGGEMLGAGAVQWLRKRCGGVVLFNHDDPTGPRDWRRFYTLRSSIGSYDLCVVVRGFNVDEFKNFGARNVICVFRSYDEVAHAPVAGEVPIPENFRSEVCFIGANYKGEDRDLFLGQLIDRGINVAIWGDQWERSPIWEKLRPHRRGGSLSGRDYVDAIRGAKLCLGFLARRNRDEHTTRSMEIPFAGGLLLAKRTAEHEALYVDGEEACFWSDARECRDKALRLLADDALRERIRLQGARRVRLNRVGNEDLIARVLARLAQVREA